jgi:TorA maturation chaperone TorD
MHDHDSTTDVSREAFSRLLAACYDAPGSDFDDARLFAPMTAAAAALDGALGRQAKRLRDAAIAEGAARIADEHRRLFGDGRQAVAACECAWLGAASRRASLDAIAKLYDDAGFDIDDAHRPVPDHIGEELRFLHLAIFRENQALRIGTPDECEAAQAIRERLVDDHLSAWVGRFAQALRTAARLRYHRELALVTERFVALEASATAAA